MFKALFSHFTTQKNIFDVHTVANKQLQQNIGVLTSLRDYDSGKKDISTSDLERRMRDIHVATR